MGESVSTGNQNTTGVSVVKAATLGKMMRAGKKRFQVASSPTWLTSTPNFARWPPRA
jgi:hypothetical protein